MSRSHLTELCTEARLSRFQVFFALPQGTRFLAQGLCLGFEFLSCLHLRRLCRHHARGFQIELCGVCLALFGGTLRFLFDFFRHWLRALEARRFLYFLEPFSYRHRRSSGQTHQLCLRGRDHRFRLPDGSRQGRFRPWNHLRWLLKLRLLDGSRQARSHLWGHLRWRPASCMPRLQGRHLGLHPVGLRPRLLGLLSRLLGNCGCGIGIRIEHLFMYNRGRGWGWNLWGLGDYLQRLFFRGHGGTDVLLGRPGP